MNWLESAYQVGIEQGRQSPDFPGRQRSSQAMARTAGEFSEAYNAEKNPTKEEISKFLDQFQEPVDAVLKDIREYSSNARDNEFIISGPHDDFIYVDYGSRNLVDKNARKYPLLSVDWGYVYDTIYAFSRSWTVDIWTGVPLTQISVFPRVSEDTHLAGVEYRVEWSSYAVFRDEDASRVLPNLQSTIAKEYSEHIARQAWYFQW